MAGTAAYNVDQSSAFMIAVIRQNPKRFLQSGILPRRVGGHEQLKVSDIRLSKFSSVTFDNSTEVIVIRCGT
jgi:hypothetical protein